MTATADLPNKNIKLFTEKLSFAAGDKSIIIDSEDGDKLKTIAKTLMKGDDGACVDSVAFVGDDIVFTLDDGSTATIVNGKTDITGADGNSIVSIIRTSGTGAPGTTDTYTITLTDASTTTFNVYNGADGSGSGTVTEVSSANTDLTIATGTSTPVLTVVSAPKLTTARTIAGVSFDGTANISLNNNAITNGAGYTTQNLSKATSSDINTGTDDAKFTTADGLAASYAGTKGFTVIAVDAATDLSVADGKAYITIPACMNGMDLIRANAVVNTAGTTNATTIDIYNVTDSVDMLSTAISIATGDTVGTAGTINTSNDSVATNDVLRIDVTTMSTTAPKGLMVVLEFRLP